MTDDTMRAEAILNAAMAGDWFRFETLFTNRSPGTSTELARLWNNLMQSKQAWIPATEFAQVFRNASIGDVEKTKQRYGDRIW